MNASFEEKGAWVQLVSMVLVLGGYFVVAGRMMARGVDSLVSFAPLFGIAVGFLVLAMACGYVVASVRDSAGSRDERDKLILWRAESNSSWLLGGGVITAIGGMVASIDNIWIAHLLLLSMVLSDVLKYVLQIVYYRRGM